MTTDLESNNRLLARASRDSPEVFGAWVWGLSPARHHTAWLRLLNSPSPRTIISAPPGFGKTTWASQVYASWWLGRNPEKHLIIASATADIAVPISASLKRVAAESEKWLSVFPGAEPDLAHGWADAFWTLKARRRGDKDPSVAASGMGGSVVSRRADLIVLDDPVKDPEQVRTIYRRDQTWQWFQSVLMTRLNPGGRVVMIGTRWHTDDIIGRCLQQGDWDSAIFPAIDARGDALWPEFFPLAKLEEIRGRMGSLDFAGLYQCRPVPPGGAILKEEWFPLWDSAPQFHHTIMVWDFALKATERGSYSACLVFGIGADGVWRICDAWRGRLEWVQIRPQFAEMLAHWRPQAILIEETQMGLVAIHDLRSGTNFAVIPVSPGRDDKESRMRAVAPHCEGGRVKIRAGQWWTNELIQELVTFPNAPNDDWADCFAYALTYLSHQAGPQDSPLIGGHSEAAAMRW